MKKTTIINLFAFWLSTVLAFGEIQVTVDHNDNSQASSSFKFKTVLGPVKGDAGARAKFVVVDGERDQNGGDLEKLHDGAVPGEEDEPAESFFFTAGTDGGRLLVDLGKTIEIKQVDTYSWHPSARGPQVYVLFASTGTTEGFKAEPKRGTDPEQCGWKRIASVDTRQAGAEPGGQYGVNISTTDGALGNYRYLLFDISQTENADGFGNTFYSEIDVIEKNAPAPEPALSLGAGAGAGEKNYEAVGGLYQIAINTSAAPDLAEWADKELAPVVREWYPKLVALLPSEGFVAPKRVTITFRPGMGGTPAATSGNRIACNCEWFRQNLKGEALGSVVHEMVHVVQQYGRARRGAGTRPPGWLTEGIPDYLRWFKYEPQTHGAEITRRNLSRARYDGSYRISANFLNWAAEKYDKDLVAKLNAAIRQGKYQETLWKEFTGHNVEELGAEWKAAMEQKVAAESPAGTNPTQSKAASEPQNQLTEQEKAAGWKLLFNGRDFTGWHNFKRVGVRPGWEVKEGALVCADPHNAGDIVTAEDFAWFELQLDYCISPGGNSGIMYHVTEAGGAAWATGPEFQLEDNKEARDPVRCGWLYALYQPPTDPQTDKPLDATKPAGEWNHVRLLISPAKCEHEINGVKYFEYVLGSDDFTNRVAKSKFSKMPTFAKFSSGALALQGDHGQVSFRNIKIKVLEAAK